MILETAIARRGAGGGFEEWGLLRGPHDLQLDHALGAVIVSFGLCVMLHTFAAFGLFAALWLLFSLVSPRVYFHMIDEPTTLKRILWYFPSLLQTAALLLPISALVCLYGHKTLNTPSAWWALVILIVPLRYFLGGILQRKGLIGDAVEYAEWTTGIIGIMFIGLGA
jgi:hypothetical protein